MINPKSGQHCVDAQPARSAPTLRPQQPQTLNCANPLPFFFTLGTSAKMGKTSTENATFFGLFLFSHRAARSQIGLFLFSHTVNRAKKNPRAFRGPEGKKPARTKWGLQCASLQRV
jgi:hypothetical protein